MKNLKINIVIPMAGLGSRFKNAGFSTPKPFIDVNGIPMIQAVLENLYYPNAEYILIARKEHVAEYKECFKTLQKVFNITIVEINNTTDGAACTVLTARKFINNEIPLMIANSDQIIDFNISDFIEHSIKEDLSGLILTFHDNDPKWSYAKIDADGAVICVKEKEPISNYATSGIYLFGQGQYFVDSAIDMIAQADKVNNEYYVAPVYNYLIKEGKKIGVYNIDKNNMHGIGTPEDLTVYLKAS